MEKITRSFGMAWRTVEKAVIFKNKLEKKNNLKNLHIKEEKGLFFIYEGTSKTKILCVRRGI